MDSDIDMIKQDQPTNLTSDNGETEEEISDTDMLKIPQVKSGKVLIENLPTDMQWQDLKDLVKEQVEPEIECYVDLYKTPGHSTGEGVVNFNKAAIAQKAIEKLNGFVVQGHKLTVSEDSEGPSRKRRRSRSGSPRLSCNKIIVGNIPYSTTWQQLKDFFRDSIGSVIKADVHTGADGEPAGSGEVTFQKEEKAREAIEKLNNTEFLGRKLFLREEREYDRQHAPLSSGGLTGMRIDPRVLQYLGVNEEPSNNVYLGNLDTNVQWQKIKDIFRLAGNVLHVKMASDSEGRSRGMALVQYDNSFDALQAVSMFNGSYLFGRPMYVRMYTESLERMMTYSSRKQNPDLPAGLVNVGMTLSKLQQSLLGAPSGMGAGGGDMGRMAVVLQQLFGGFDQSDMKRSKNQSCTVYIKNLDRSVTWQMLKDRFKPIGNVQFVDVMKDHRNSIGTVRFSSPGDAERAVRLMNGTRFEGKVLRVYIDN